MSKFMRGYYTDLNEDSEEHIFLDTDEQPLCNSTPWKKGSLIKTEEINKKLFEEMYKKDSLVLNVTCVKCRRIFKDVSGDEFWSD